MNNDTRAGLTRLRNAQLRLLLQEARDLLWHGYHVVEDAPCSGCDLERRIDEALGIDGQEAGDG